MAEARGTLDANIYNATGRASYLAALNAARALIHEKTGRAVKTHKGVRSELHRLTKGDQRVTAELRAFLDVGYSLKVIADYDAEPAADLSRDQASEAIEMARSFVEKIGGGPRRVSAAPESWVERALRAFPPYLAVRIFLGVEIEPTEQRNL